jgi:hypothetical protein
VSRGRLTGPESCEALSTFRGAEPDDERQWARARGDEARRWARDARREAYVALLGSVRRVILQSTQSKFSESGVARIGTQQLMELYGALDEQVTRVIFLSDTRLGKIAEELRQASLATLGDSSKEQHSENVQRLNKVVIEFIGRAKADLLGGGAGG